MTIIKNTLHDDHKDDVKDDMFSFVFVWHNMINSDMNIYFYIKICLNSKIKKLIHIIYLFAIYIVMHGFYKHNTEKLTC